MSRCTPRFCPALFLCRHGRRCEPPSNPAARRSRGERGVVWHKGEGRHRHRRSRTSGDEVGVHRFLPGFTAANHSCWCSSHGQLRASAGSVQRSQISWQLRTREERCMWDVEDHLRQQPFSCSSGDIESSRSLGCSRSKPSGVVVPCVELPPGETQHQCKREGARVIGWHPRVRALSAACAWARKKPHEGRCWCSGFIEQARKKSRSY